MNSQEPIAIVGMACRFPSAPDLATFWRQLLDGKNCATECPPGAREGRVGELYSDTTSIPSACRHGAFLTDIDQFDAEFFRISPSEAEFLDPQQRMMLETSWQALENANIDPESLRGSSASVFAGMSNNDYRYLILNGADTSQAAASLYTITGTSLNTAIGRVSFALGFEGPAMTVDTACSSSLVAMHQAAIALRSGETDVALAGGVQLILSGKLTELRANAGMLSPDGICKTFDESANGYVRGEGCGIVVLKRLKDAERDGDHVWAVVAATAINQDGSSEGLTVPRGTAQKAVIEAAIDQAKIDPACVDYLEAHGTGTPVGDPIEINAAAEVYGRGRTAETPLLVGSVKTNIGHLEPAAGVAGVIKAALALQFGFIPKHLNFEVPSSEINWDALPIKVVNEAIRWPEKQAVERFAGINSFGFSGTNAHVILQGYTDSESTTDLSNALDYVAGAPQAVEVNGSLRKSPSKKQSEISTRSQHVLPISGKSPSSLKEVANEYITRISKNGDESLDSISTSESALLDFSWTSSVGRSHFNFRKGLVFDGFDSLVDGLSAVDSLSTIDPCVKPERIAFAYTGQGSQWVGMGMSLYESEPVFRDTVDRCEQVILDERKTSLIDRMFGTGGDATDLEDPKWVQPVIYTLQCGLTDLWASIGVTPAIVFGHSLGEIAAARTAGIFSLEDGCRFASGRGRLMSELPGPGLMAAVFLSEDEIEQAISDYNDDLNGTGVSVAAKNGAHQVVSGYAHELEPLLELLEGKDVRVRRLKKSPAYHSKLVEPILADLGKVISTLEVGTSQIPLVSNLTGELIEADQLLNGDYWQRHARGSVAYRKGVESVAAEGADAVLEIGPSDILGPMTEMAWPASSTKSPVVLASMRMPREGHPEIPSDGGFLNCVCEAFESGLDIDFDGLYAGETRRKINIPGYPFQRRRHWVQSRRRRVDDDDHVLLGTKHETPYGDINYVTEIDASDPIWLQEHVVFGQILVPGAFFGAMGVESLGQFDEIRVDDLQLHNPMLLKNSDEEESSRKLQLVLQKPTNEGTQRFEIFSRGAQDSSWLLHATGEASPQIDESESPQNLDRNHLIETLEEQDLTEYYKQKSATNIQLGTPFRNLKALWSGDGKALAEISVRDEDLMQGIALQPLLLDACFQVLAAARESTELGQGATYIPFGWDRLVLRCSMSESVFCVAEMHQSSLDDESENEQAIAEALSGDLWLYDQSGKLCGELTGLTVKRATRSSLLSSVEDPADLIYEIEWQNREHVAAQRARYPLAQLDELQNNVEPFFNYLTAEGVTPEARLALLQDLEKLAHSWVVTAFDDAGWDRSKGSNLRLEELIAQFGIAPIHKNLVRRMMRMMTDAGILVTVEDGEYNVVHDKDTPLPDGIAPPEQLFTDLCEKHPHGLYELTLLSRFGAKFFELLTENADPLALLFEEDSSGAADFYRTAPVSAAGNRLLGDVLSRIVQDLPDDRPLRVIEIGAGTGATTEIVFEELASKNLTYTYTDISAGFFAEAERNFAGNGIDIEYLALDIENDPQAQGFEDGTYDIVIAANVLHATRNLLETLTNCRKLLAPGGVLIALESLRGRAWQDLTFGFLDGWWRYNDDYRKNHALASPDIWRSALSDAGYAASVVFGSETLTETSGPLGSGTIVAQAPTERVLRPGTWVIEPDRADVGQRLIERLRSLGQSVIATSFDGEQRQNAISHPVLPEVLEGMSPDEPLRGVIHLAGLDGHGVDATVDEMRLDVICTTDSALSLTKILMESGVRPTLGTSYVTRGAQVLDCEQKGQLAGAALWGFGKVVELESSLLAPRMVDLDPESDSFESLIADLIEPDTETHIAYRHDTRYTARLIQSRDQETRISVPAEGDWIVNSGKDGSLLNVSAVPFERSDLRAREVRVRVEATGLNFSDVLVALGAQVPNASLGLEFAGCITEVAPDVDEFEIGQRVVGMGFGTFGTEITTHASLIAIAPDNLTFDELATIPIVFATAEIGFELANLKVNDKVLIHSAAGGVGLAAIQLVRAAGAEAIATASTPKHAFLRSQGVEHVFDSRRLDFSDEILELTDGKGVDVVLNSLTSEGFIEASLACLKQKGRFIEIGRLNILTQEEMGRVRPDVDYHVLSLDVLKREEPDRVGQSFRPLIERFATCELVPLRHTKWPMAEIGDALQYMGSAKHVGKLVLTIPALANGTVRDDRTYLITGGLGGIGCAVASWLVERGARHLVLNGRRAPDDSSVETIEELRSLGANISVKIADMTEPTQVDTMFAEIVQEMPELAGVVHSVGVLSDGAIPNQTWERFEEVLWPKILGAWHLHEFTKRMDLDFFVLFSSATGVLGNAGQANHAAANSFLDQLAAHRRAIGLPGQSIAWGAWSDIGEAAEQKERIATQLETTGTGWITPELGIKTLDHLIRHDMTNPAAMSIDWNVLAESLNSPPPFLINLLANDVDDGEGEGDTASIDVTELRACDTEARMELLMAYIQNQLQSILRLPALPARNVGFFDLGMDSLMAVELRNRLIRTFEGEMAISRTVVFDHPDVTALATHLSAELGDAAAANANFALSEPIPQQTTNQQIAVIGLACRFPGASDYETFWNNLNEGHVAISDCRNGNRNWHGVVGAADAEEPYLRYGGFVDGIDEFDARFFGIRPIEARSMDPRQRMLLETSWQAIENAGIDPNALRGTRVGLYIGLGGSEYRDLVSSSGFQDSYLGTSGGMTTGRISYVFGLTGPAMSFDLACASSLVSIHEGIKALQNGEVDLALVGGANAILSPAIMRFHRELGLLATNGECTPFDDDAQGYVRGEGCGILVLKRREDAETDGDPIWSTLLGSAVNQNGVSAGLTVPNGSAQEQVMMDAVARANVDPAELDFLESHATGLSLSDPIELRAASAVYTSSTERDRPLRIGSIKGSIGHLEWAAGVAGVIKLILSMSQRTIPPQTTLRERNQQVDWESNRMEVNQSSIAWPLVDGRPPVGAVSAFGMSGTNAHVLLQGNVDAIWNGSTRRDVPVVRGQAVSVPYSELPIQCALDLTNFEHDALKRRTRLFPLSGKTPESVVALAHKYASWLQKLRLNDLDETFVETFLADVAWTACVGRSHFNDRKGIVFDNLTTLVASLQSLTQQDIASTEDVGISDVVFSFDGDSREWLGFGQNLYEREPFVKTFIDYCVDVVDDLGCSGAISSLTSDRQSLNQDHEIVYSDLTTFVVQVAASTFWQTIGISPSAVIGSSLNRYAANCITGDASLEESIQHLIESSKNGETKDSAAADADGDTKSVDSELENQIVIGPNPHTEPNDGVTDDPLLWRINEAYESGLPVDLRSLFVGENRQRITLPTYAFSRRPYWFND